MRPVGRSGAVAPGHEIRGVGLVLDQPAAPQVGDAALVAGAGDDAEGVLVDGGFDDVGGRGGDGAVEGRVALQEGCLEEAVLVGGGFDAGVYLARSGARGEDSGGWEGAWGCRAIEGGGWLQVFGQHLACRRARTVHLGVPRLQARLLLEPPLAHQETVYHAPFVLLPARFPRGGHHFARDDGAVGPRDLGQFQLAGDDALDLVFEAQGDFGDFGGGVGRGDAVVAGGGEDCWEGVSVGWMLRGVESEEWEEFLYTLAELRAEVVVVAARGGGGEELAPLDHCGVGRVAVLLKSRWQLQMV